MCNRYTYIVTYSYNYIFTYITYLSLCNSPYIHTNPHMIEEDKSHEDNNSVNKTSKLIRF